MKKRMQPHKSYLERPMEEMLTWVPDKAGIHFTGCPNCSGGYQDSQMGPWSPDRPNTVSCRYCKMEYPNDRYADDRIVCVKSPGGKTIEYPYYEDDTGYRFYFTAAVAYEKRLFCESVIEALAKAYADTEKRCYGIKAAAMMHQITKMWPNFCWHYDYPFQQKIWYDGVVAPADCRAGYRTARWNWWAFSDLSYSLLTSYERLASTDIWQDSSLAPDAQDRIVDFFCDIADHLIAQDTPLGNMHPVLWRSVVKLGLILEDLRYIHQPIGDMSRLIREGFFADGTWHEGSPDYMRQTINGIDSVCDLLDEWNDPPDYTPKSDDLFLDDEPVSEKFEILKRAKKALDLLHLPNDTRLTVHDSWGHAVYPYPSVLAEKSDRSFLLSALGHAALTAGKGEDITRADLTWSGGYGHQHMDGLSLSMFAYGREMLSDIGYTHTKYRSYTLASGAHNTVLIDRQNQEPGSIRKPTDGNLCYMSCNDPQFQAVKVENATVYDRAKTYERMLVRVGMDEKRSYFIDAFELKGGRLHDMFYHGDCLAEQRLLAFDSDQELAFAPVESLMEKDDAFVPPTGEHQSYDCRKPGYAYGFFKEIEAFKPQNSKMITTDMQYTGRPVGAQSEDSAEGSEPLGLRIHMEMSEQDVLYRGKAPSVRQANKDDNMLDHYRRSFWMWRKNASANGSRFQSVIEPYRHIPAIKRVSMPIKTESASVWLVEWNDTVDVVFTAAVDSVSISLFGHTLVMQGELGFLRFKNEELCRTRLIAACVSYGNVCKKSDQAASYMLQSIQTDANGVELCVYDQEGACMPEKGEIAVLHTAHRARGVIVDSVATDGGLTRLRLQNNPELSYDAQKMCSRDTVFPMQTYCGVHSLCVYPTFSDG